MKFVEHTNKEALALTLRSDDRAMSYIVNAMPDDTVTLTIRQEYKLPASEAKKLLKEILSENSNY